MASLTLDYGSIRAAYNAADKTAKECDECVSDIKSKVTKKIGELEMGANTNTSIASSYLDKKIAQLNKKHDAFATYSDRLDDFLNGSDGAIQVDKNVRESIGVEAVNYRNSNGMQTTPVDLFFAWLGTLMDSSEFGRWLNDAFTDIGEWLDDVKYWYKCDGGKYIIGAIVTVLVTIVAVVVAIVLWPVSAIAMVAAGILIAITVLDAMKDIQYNIVAYNTDDPAWAQRYDSYDSMTSYLRKNRFDSPWMNKYSPTIALGIDYLELVCNAICLADSIAYFNPEKTLSIIGLINDIASVADSLQTLTKNIRVDLEKIIEFIKSIPPVYPIPTGPKFIPNHI